MNIWKSISVKRRIYKLLDCKGQLIFVENIPFYLVSEESWNRVTENKKQPSQTYEMGKKSFCLMKKEEFYDDKYYWVPHEIGHCRYAFRDNEKFEYLPYPDNKKEREAFKNQIKGMLDDGKSSFECYRLLKEGYRRYGEWKEEYKSFFKEMISEVADPMESLTDHHVHIGRYFSKMYGYKEVFKAIKLNGIKKIVYAYLLPKIEDKRVSEQFFYWQMQETKQAEKYARKLGLKTIPLYWVDPLVLSGNDKKGEALKKILEEGGYKGFAIHPVLHGWGKDEKLNGLLNEMFIIAKNYHLPIYIHTGESENDRPLLFKNWCEKYNEVEIHLAHCKVSSEIKEIFDSCENVYGDTAFCPKESYEFLCEAGHQERLLLGTDFPIMDWYDGGTEKRGNVKELSKEYRKCLENNCYKNLRKGGKQ